MRRGWNQLLPLSHFLLLGFGRFYYLNDFRILRSRFGFKQHLIFHIQCCLVRESLVHDWVERLNLGEICCCLVWFEKWVRAFWRPVSCVADHHIDSWCRWCYYTSNLCFFLFTFCLFWLFGVLLIYWQQYAFLLCRRSPLLVSWYILGWNSILKLRSCVFRLF